VKPRLAVVRLTVLFAVLGLGLAAGSPAQFVFFPVTEAAIEPGGVCAGPDGNIWFTVGNQVGRITLSGTVTKFDLPTANASPGAIVAGPDGNLWFLERAASKIGRISTSGAVTEFTPGAHVGVAIVVGPDGALWFYGDGSLRRVTVSGDFTAYPAPGAGPICLVTGSDGNFWFVEERFQLPQRVGRFTPLGSLSLFQRPSDAFGWSCAPGPDGNVWYTTDDQIFGRVTPSGTISEFLIGDRFSIATSVTVGPDGNLWMPVITAFQCVEPCRNPPPIKNGVLRVSTDATVMRYDWPDGVNKMSDVSKITAGSEGSLWFTARSGLVRFFPSQLAPPSSVPVLDGFARATLLTLLALAGLVALRR
jgi:streptogramin lyase